MTIAAWIALIIGMCIGGTIGIIVGVCLSDQWWRKNVSKYSHLIPHTETKNETKRGNK